MLLYMLTNCRYNTKLKIMKKDYNQLLLRPLKRDNLVNLVYIYLSDKIKEVDFN